VLQTNGIDLAVQCRVSFMVRGSGLSPSQGRLNTSEISVS